MRVPASMTADMISQAIGPGTKVPTLNCETQQTGPRLSLADWVRYFGSPAKRQRQPLLNVVSLSLAGTQLQVPSPGCFVAASPSLIPGPSLSEPAYLGTPGYIVRMDV
jgi:hypothetical protein